MSGTRWSNWSGSASCRPSKYHAPSTEAELRALVESLDPSTRTLRVAGSGHSFPPVVPSDDVLCSLENYAGIVDVDTDARRATVRAGTRLDDLNAALADHGLAMENLGDIARQSIAGAIGTGTHGTGIDLGILSTQVAGLRLITADGEVVECSRSENPDLFRAAQVSLGAVGVVSTVTLDLVPAYDLELQTRPLSLDRCLDALPDLRAQNRHFEFFWFPHTDTALVKTMNRVEGDEPAGSSGWLPTARERTRDLVDAADARLENLAWEGLCRFSTAVSGTAPYAGRVAAATLSASSEVGPSHEVFANRRDVRFDETEWSVPVGEGATAVRQLRRWLDRRGEDVCFPIEFRYVAGDEIPLSPAYGRDSAMVAVHTYHRKPHDRYFRAAESVFRDLDGRPHWGKHHSLDATDLAPRYPEWERFQSVRRDRDPSGLFMNDHLRRLFEPEAVR